MLTGAQLSRITNALVTSFNFDELRRVILESMEVDFTHHVGREKTFTAQVFDFVEWANHNDRGNELVGCIAKARPNSSELQNLHVSVTGDPNRSILISDRVRGTTGLSVSQALDALTEWKDVHTHVQGVLGGLDRCLLHIEQTRGRSKALAASNAYYCWQQDCVVKLTIMREEWTRFQYAGETYVVSQFQKRTSENRLVETSRQLNFESHVVIQTRTRTELVDLRSFLWELLGFADKEIVAIVQSLKGVVAYERT